MLSPFKELQDTRSAQRYLEITDKIRQDAPDKTALFWDQLVEPTWHVGSTYNLQDSFFRLYMWQQQTM